MAESRAQVASEPAGDEDELVFGLLNRAGIAKFREKVGLDWPYSRWTTWNEVATRDGIRHYAYGFGDDNPGFLESGGLTPKLPPRPKDEAGRGNGTLAGAHMYRAGDHLRIFRPVRERERIRVRRFCTSIEETLRRGRRRPRPQLAGLTARHLLPVVDRSDADAGQRTADRTRMPPSFQDGGDAFDRLGEIPAALVEGTCTPEHVVAPARRRVQGATPGGRRARAPAAAKWQGRQGGGHSLADGGERRMTVKGLEHGQRCALVISECQQAMIVEEYRGVRDELARQAAERGIVPAIAELAEAFRRAGQPVVHSHLVPRPGWAGFRVNCVLAGKLKRTGHLLEGEPGAEPHAELRPEPGDFVVRRPTGMTSFYGTEIDALLRAEDVRTVVVVGVSTNVAVYGTVLEAVNRGYDVVVPTDCIAGVGAGALVVQSDLLPLLAAMTERSQIVAELTAAHA